MEFGPAEPLAGAALAAKQALWPAPNCRNAGEIGNLTEKWKKIVARPAGAVILILDLGRIDPFSRLLLGKTA